MGEAVVDRLHEATLLCAGRAAFRFTVEDVAREAGVSRATVYRAFPGGKDQLIADSVTWEVGRFFARLQAAVQAASGLEEQLVTALVVGHRLLEEHEVLHTLLRDDPEALAATMEAPMRQVRLGLEQYLDALLAHEPLDPGVDPAEAAEYLARMYLGHLGFQGSVDLDDVAAVRRLVRTQFVAGILAGG